MTDRTQGNIPILPMQNNQNCLASQWILECFRRKSEAHSSKKIYPKLTPTEKHSEPSQTCSLEFFYKIVNG